MTQNDIPAPPLNDVPAPSSDDIFTPPFMGRAKAAIEQELTFNECAPPPLPTPAPKLAKPAPPAPRRSAVAPDPFAVGLRVLRMAPAWLLFTAVCCTAVVLLLGWMRTVGEAGAVTLPSKHNDARAAKRVAADDAPSAKTEAVSPANASTAETSAQKSTAANDALAQAAAQATTAPAPGAQTPQTAPAAAQQTEEKAQVKTSAPVADAGGRFTAQVGSYSNQSEANAQVSRLRAAGFDAHVAAAALPGRGTWYRVQVGRFAERGEASKTVAVMRAKGAAAGALVVPLQK